MSLSAWLREAAGGAATGVGLAAAGGEATGVGVEAAGA